jgi:predicted porin
MQKKVMALAVATALAAPAAALAQAGSSVQIYGGLSVSFEGAEAKGADTSTAPLGGGSSIRAGNLGGGYATTNVDQPIRTRTQAAGSNVGVRGREDLGNGLYMGFQAELSIAMGGVTPESPGGNGVKAAWRNSGVWLGGRWGEFGLGLWDLPANMNQTLGAGHAAYANASTSMSAGLLGGGLGSTAAGTSSGQDIGQFCGASALGASATSCFQNALSFHRRQSNSIWYQSPTWAGFRGRVAYGATSGSTSNASNDGNPSGEVKAQLWGVGVSYTLGGLYAGVGYEWHGDYITTAARAMGTNITTTGATMASTAGTACAGLGNGFAIGGQVALGGNSATAACMPVGSATTAGLSGDDGNFWNVNLRYTFPFGLSIGGYYEWAKWEMNYSNTSGAEVGLVNELKRDAWRLDAAYQLGAHTFGIQWGQGREIKGASSNASFNGDGTGTDVWIFGYAYSLSKRSSVFAYYTYVDNETNSRSSGIVFNGIGPNAGGDPKYLGVGLRHLF